MQVHSSHSFTAWLSLWGLFLCFAIIVQGRLKTRRLGYDLHCDRKLIMGHIGSCCMRLSFLSVCHDAGHCFFWFSDIRPLLSHPLNSFVTAQRLHSPRRVKASSMPSRDHCDAHTVLRLCDVQKCRHELAWQVLVSTL